MLLACVAVSACAHDPVPVASAVCPAVKTFSRAWQMELASEMDQITPASAINDALLDWERMRSQLKVCHQ